MPPAHVPDDRDSGHPSFSLSSLPASTRSTRSRRSPSISTTSATFTCKPPSAPFFSPSLRRSRHRSYLRWLLTTSFLCAMILALLSIYWGGLVAVPQNLPSLTVLIVDLDRGSLVGAAVQHIANTGGLHPLRAVVATDTPDETSAVARIYREEHWAGVIVRADATAAITAGVNGAAYNPRAAVAAVYVGARQETVLNTYILPALREFERRVAREVAGAVVGLVRAGDVEPSLLNPCVEFDTLNLRPFDPPVALAAVSVGQIYLIVFSFFSFSFYLPVHTSLLIPPATVPPLRFAHYILYRIVLTTSAYFCFSLFYSLISLLFGIPFALPACATVYPCRGTAFGQGSFPAYWALNFVGTIALGFPCENVGMLVGFPYFGLWLIFWVISNVVVSFYAIPLAPGFYRYGYAWPVYHIVRGSRTILFDTKNDLALNFGVLLAWALVSVALFPACCWVAAWKLRREKERERGMGRAERRERGREREIRRGSVVRTEG